MSARRKTWPDLIAYVIKSKKRTANAATLLNKAIMALVVLGATVVAVAVLALDMASPLQLALFSGGAATLTAAVRSLKGWWGRRKSPSVEQPVSAQASD